uniref:Putative secreted protein n=1 Tax=Panstrongylus lignarius TaxID=156445 RepID=A0A224XTM8_9HEMI
MIPLVFALFATSSILPSKCGEENLSGKSFNNFSLAISATGPNRTTGLIKPGCLKTTLSYAGNLLTPSPNTTSSQ